MVDESRDPTSRINYNSRRRLLRVMGSSAAATSLAGCSLISSNDIGSSGSPDEVSIGILAGSLDLATGPSQRDAAKLAVEDAKADGVLEGADYSVHTRDTKLASSPARDAYRELTIREEVDATFGLVAGAANLTVMEEMKRQRLLNFATGSLNMGVPERIKNDYETYKYHFRVRPQNAVQIGQEYGYMIEEFADRQGWDTVGYLAEDFQEIIKIKDVSVQKIRELDNVELAYNEIYPTGTENFGPYYDDVQSEDCDVLLTVMALAGLKATNQWAKQERPFEFGGINLAAFDTSFLEQTNGNGEYVWSATQFTADSEQTQKTIPWIERFIDRFGYSPQYPAPATYDSVRMYLRAIAETGTKDEDTLIKHIEQMEYENPYFYETPLQVNGPDHKWPHGPQWDEKESLTPVWFQWQTEDGRDGSGKQKVYWPDQAATTDLQTPPWLRS